MTDRSDRSDASGKEGRPASIARLAMLVACASVLQVAESLLPHPLPGVRVGLANIVTIVTLAELGPSWALQLAFYRSLVSSLVLGTFLAPAFVLSLAGGFASALVMTAVHALACRVPGIGFVGISVAGAVSHTLAQVGLVWLLFIHSPGVLALAPWLVLAAVATGLLTGLVAVQALGRIEERKGERVMGNGEKKAAGEPLTRDAGPVTPGLFGRARPEYKVAAAALLALVLVIFNRAAVYAAVFVLLAALTAVGRVRPAALLSGLGRAWPLLVAAFALPVLFSPWGRILLQLGPLRITEPGLREGGLFAARLLLLLLTTRLLALVTAPADLARGITRLLSPLRRAGANPDAIGQALGLAWAHFPAMLGRALESIRRRGRGRSRLERLVNLPGGVVADLYIAAVTADTGAGQ